MSLEEERLECKSPLLRIAITDLSLYNEGNKKSDLDRTEQLSRKKKPETYIEPMPKGKFLELMKAFKSKGGKVLMNKEAQRILEFQGAEACTFDENTILFRRRPGRAAVYEELFHVEQFREGKVDGTVENVYSCEIEAKRYLLENAEKLELTEIEIKCTRDALEWYMKKLDLKKGSSSYDDL